MSDFDRKPDAHESTPLIRPRAARHMADVNDLNKVFGFLETVKDLEAIFANNLRAYAFDGTWGLFRGERVSADKFYG
jgi:hypothetical protein